MRYSPHLKFSLCLLYLLKSYGFPWCPTTKYMKAIYVLIWERNDLYYLLKLYIMINRVVDVGII